MKQIIILMNQYKPQGASIQTNSLGRQKKNHLGENKSGSNNNLGAGEKLRRFRFGPLFRGVIIKTHPTLLHITRLISFRSNNSINSKPGKRSEVMLSKLYYNRAYSFRFNASDCFSCTLPTFVVLVFVFRIIYVLYVMRYVTLSS